MPGILVWFVTGPPDTIQVTLKDEVTRKEELLKVLASKRIEITVMDGLKASLVSFGKNCPNRRYVYHGPPPK
jgi:hypothetical protein